MKSKKQRQAKYLEWHHADRWDGTTNGFCVRFTAIKVIACFWEREIHHTSDERFHGMHDSVIDNSCINATAWTASLMVGEVSSTGSNSDHFDDWGIICQQEPLCP